ncbi:MAG: hypothetical protein AAF985_21135 [Bacteroidota bacterium]
MNVFQQMLFLSSLLLTLCLSQKTMAQPGDSLYTLHQQLPENIRFFTTDQLQQCYLVTKENELIKYNDQGNLLFRFNNNRLGALAFVDATDPFNLLLYYPEFLTVIFLDRTLNPTGEYNLYDLDIIEVKALGLANDNNIWIYDDVSFRVKKINRNGTVLSESDDLSLLLGQGIQPNFIVERQNLVFVNDPEVGILQFDLFGQYVKTLEITGLREFQILDSRLIYRQEGTLYSFHLESLATQKIAFPQGQKKLEKIEIQKDRMYIQDGNQLFLYAY